MKAIVIGGGIGGLTAAIALRKAGFDANVYERALVMKEIGAGVALASNAITALSHLGLADEVAAQGIPLANGAIKTWKGEVIVKGSEETRAFLNVCVHRADLLRVLVEALGKDLISLAHECTGFEERGDVVAVRFSNGQEVEADSLEPKSTDHRDPVTQDIQLLEQWQTFTWSRLYQRAGVVESASA